MKGESIGECAKGRWRGVLSALGLEEKFFAKKHGPCPFCEGTDRYRYIDKEGSGSWFCGQCGNGDGVEMAKRITGLGYADLAKEIRRLAVGAPVDRIVKAAASATTRREAAELWNQGSPITRADPAGRYLAWRVPGLTKISTALRYIEKCKFVNDGRSSWHPALLACVKDDKGEPVAVHRTYLTVEGRKADMPEPRKLTRGTLPGGSAIQLAKAGKVLGVAEGIETALSASILHGIPVWSLINAVNLERWNPPEGVEKVVVFGDNDLNFTGQAVSYTLARRMMTKKPPTPTEVAIPDEPGDWNDIHRK